MHIVTKKRLAQFWSKHPDAENPLRAWYRIVSRSSFRTLIALQDVFPSADYVPPQFVVFNIGGNKYRLIVAIHFNAGRVFIRHVLTHAQYDRWKPLS